MPDQITPPTPTQQPSLPAPESWDTITSDAPAAPAAEVPESPAPADADSAPAETATLETATPLPVETPPSRESESPDEPEPPKETKSEKDEDVKEGDTPEILALPSGSASRRWAREQFHLAKPIHAFLDPKTDIEVLGDALFESSSSRYSEHVSDIIKRHHDDASQMLFGMPFKDAKAKLAATTNGQPAPTTTTTPQSAVTLPTLEEIDLLSNEQVAEKFAQVQQAAAQQAKAELEKAMTEKVGTLEKQLQELLQEKTTDKEKARESQVAQIQDDLLASVVKVVDEVIHDSGLEVKPEDPPKIANLKRAAARMIKTEYESTFDEDDENIKVVDRVREFAKRLERHNAFREEDNLKVRLRAACEKIKQRPEFGAIYDEIEAYANQSKATTRTGGPVVPSVPGAPAGIAPSDPKSWDEAIEQSKAAASQ